MAKAKSSKAIPKEIIGAFFVRNSEVIQQWLSEVTINCVDRDGRSLIFQAVLVNWKEVLEQLIKYSPDLNLRDKLGYTALHYATQNYLVDIAGFLIEKGAEVDCKSNSGTTPLFVAVAESKGRGDMIKLLLAKGADPDALNNSGNSPRSFADKIANYDIKQFFRSY
ncbi:ankyrin repeat domain-containing protein [Desertivirga arenae]|uniref:ankyrin repeat domain-containing protein n=1 Tax=Desertivirga arenae TaxID=2810309 RepID=UPI001A95B963|nr:ankyrin repeat domain-containing protein [Pedobacter sp. SYSU D00823]